MNSPPTYLSGRYFAHLTTKELLNWRPSYRYFQWNSPNISKANREYRRRAAREGFSNVIDWMRHHA